MCIYTNVTVTAFGALADPTRRRIVEALGAGERSVNDLVARVDIRQSGVSRHLRILHDAGFVTVRVEGQHRFYSLRPEPFLELAEWVSGYRTTWERRLDRLGRVVEGRSQARPTKREEPR
ncbi:MAG: metalloregulator ArsR/SmtB family transcription factor [Thermoplasmata archaeon]|nr:metalloregulator ArsR/SmtB family transcription factor [Thermoplasmata archaeon]